MAKYHVRKFLDIAPESIESFLNEEYKKGFQLVDFHDDEGYVTVITFNESADDKSNRYS